MRLSCRGVEVVEKSVRHHVFECFRQLEGEVLRRIEAGLPICEQLDSTGT